MFRFALRACALFILCGMAAAAPAAGDAGVPAVLGDWRAWVLKDLDYRACPFLSTQMRPEASGYVCAWPGRLSLHAAGDGGSFTVHWRVDAPSWVELPGDTQHWPQDVVVNNQHQPVLARGDVPALWLPPGSYEIAGRIPWHERPQSLHVPAGIGLVALDVDGKSVAPVQRDGDAVTLGRSAAVAPEADSLQLQVFRMLADGVLAELTTQIRLNVSGQARRNDRTRATRRIHRHSTRRRLACAPRDNDGRLHVQVQPAWRI